MTPCCSGQRHPPVSLINHLEWFAAFGSRIQDVVEGLPKLIWPSDYNPLLLFCGGTNDTARGNLDSIKSDYRALGVVVKGTGDPGGVLINPASEWKECEEKGTSMTGH